MPEEVFEVLPLGVERELLGLGEEVVSIRTKNRNGKGKGKGIA